MGGRVENPDVARSVRPAPSGDLWLELYRQQTLLLVMAARLRESASNLEQKGPIEMARIRRAIDVHHRFLQELRVKDEERLDRALRDVP
jgi:hemerythrin-like domain-containing protein